MKGNIMDKKILLGGAAALIMAGSMVATPAAAGISLELSGEAKVTLGMSDSCGDAPATAAAQNDVTGETTLAALNTATGITFTSDSAGSMDVDTVTFTDYRCNPVTADNDNPVWGFGKEIGISASGTLANGLEVAFSDTLDLTDLNAEEGSFELELGGAFGTLVMGSVDSAVDSTSVGMPGELDHDLATDGAAGFGLSYSLPTMGALDVAISYFPNADDAGLDDSEYMDTFGIGAAFDAGMATVSFGFESASSNDASCAVSATAVHTITTAADLITAVYGDSVCGDMDTMAIGAEMPVSDLTLSAGYSTIDSDSADRNTMSFGVETSVGDYTIGAGYAVQTLEHELGGNEDETTAVNFTAETALGDGVDLTFEFIQTDEDLFSQAQGAGENSTYEAEIALVVGF
tara:strand:- start:7342 stop:8553 length:1212 start_codon:yes stop_codon:yes gene_type:complete